MRFHGVMMVRDEADIVEETIRGLMTWLDALHVLDTGSTDGTREVLRGLAAADRRVSIIDDVCGGGALEFANNLRGVIFERAKGTFEDGDWVGRLDADEFYHESPRAWLAANVRPWEGAVYAQMYEFMVTHREAADWEAGREGAADRARPVAWRRRRYAIEPVVELRLFRYRRGMRWMWESSRPLYAGVPAAARIPVRHYRWRDPEQMRRRCVLRSVMTRRVDTGVHWSKSDWREWLWDDLDPRLLRWTPGEALPFRSDVNHLKPWLRRWAQRAFYAVGGARVTAPWRDVGVFEARALAAEVDAAVRV